MDAEFEVKYELGHSYQEKWRGPEFFCPLCGKKSVWVEQGAGDYYNGPLHLCIECGATLCHPSETARPDWQDKQRIEKMRLIQERIERDKGE